jgi:predicted ABC-type ATPase
VASERQPTIYVLAGPNAGGKSSIGGEIIRRYGGNYFNPDEYAVALKLANPGLTDRDANSAAWEEGVKRLRNAIDRRQSYTFETTLGGETICRLLHQAADNGLELWIWYIALDSVEGHLARVRARAARGGHDIPESLVRLRYDNSRANLAGLLHKATRVVVYDNSWTAATEKGEPPEPRLILDYENGVIKNKKNLQETPDWAKPIVAAALEAELSKKQS